MEYFRKIGKVAIPAAMLAMPFLTLAALPEPVSPYSGSELTLDEIETLINQIAQFLIVIAVVIAVIFIIWGGIKYMTARGDAKVAEEAKGTIINGIIGAAVVLGVGVILSTLSSLITRSFFG